MHPLEFKNHDFRKGINVAVVDGSVQHSHHQGCVGQHIEVRAFNPGSSEFMTRGLAKIVGTMETVPTEIPDEIIALHIDPTCRTREGFLSGIHGATFVTVLFLRSYDAW